MKTTLVMFAFLTFMITTISFCPQQEDPWKVPAKYEKLVNPVVPDAASIASGKELYHSYCTSCHGKNGIGNGKRADHLNTTPSDFTSSKFQQQTDGALLYKIYVGHKDMPGFKKTIPGNKDVLDGTFGKTRNPGDLVNYIRTFAKR